MVALNNTSYAPSQARCVYVTVYPPVDTGLSPLYNWPNKNPSDVLDYWLDLSQVMLDAGCVLIQADAFVVSATGPDALTCCTCSSSGASGASSGSSGAAWFDQDLPLNVLDVAWNNYYIRVNLADGQNDYSYVVQVVGTRNDGTQQSWQIGIYVDSLLTIAVPAAGDVLTQWGSVLTIGPYSLPNGLIS
jgi:hypothetical protein